MVNKCYQKHIENLRKEVRERYQNIYEEDKNKRLEKTQVRYQNFNEGEKEKRCKYYQERQPKLSEYRRNYSLTH